MARTVGEKRSFQNIKYCFRRPEGILLEIVRNSARAGATWLDIHSVGNHFLAVDNGKGAESIKPLLCLSRIGWNEDVVETRNPGCGSFCLMRIADTIKYVSKFGASGEIDCNRYLKEEAYRHSVFESVDAGASIDGLMIIAALKEGIAEKILAARRELSYFPIDISVNGEKVSCTMAAEVNQDNRVKCGRHGNDVFINPEPRLSRKAGISCTIIKTPAMWYGSYGFWYRDR